jgi:hypothetical protein
VQCSDTRSACSTPCSSPCSTTPCSTPRSVSCRMNTLAHPASAPYDECVQCACVLCAVCCVLCSVCMMLGAQSSRRAGTQRVCCVHAAVTGATDSIGTVTGATDSIGTQPSPPAHSAYAVHAVWVVDAAHEGARATRSLAPPISGRSPPPSLGGGRPFYGAGLTPSPLFMRTRECVIVCV